MPAWLQPQWRGSQNKRQSQPHSSLERRMALSSVFSRASMRAIPEARSRARRRFVGRGWRKKQSSTSTPSTSRSSSETSSRVSRSAWAHSTVPFLVSCGRESRAVKRPLSSLELSISRNWFPLEGKSQQHRESTSFTKVTNLTRLLLFGNQAKELPFPFRSFLKRNKAETFIPLGQFKFLLRPKQKSFYETFLVFKSYFY